MQVPKKKNRYFFPSCRLAIRYRVRRLVVYHLTVAGVRVEPVNPRGLRPPVSVLGLYEALVLRVGHQVGEEEGLLVVELVRRARVARDDDVRPVRAAAHGQAVVAGAVALEMRTECLRFAIGLQAKSTNPLIKKSSDFFELPRCSCMFSYSWVTK